VIVNFTASSPSHSFPSVHPHATMNHKASESRTRIIHPTHSYTYSQQQQYPPLHSSSPNANHDDQPRNPPKDETDAEKADRLLAATLLFYKEASITSLTNFNPSISPLFLELQTFTQHHSLARQFVVPGDTLLEQRSAGVTLLTGPWEAEPSITTIIDFLFWMIVNLRKPLVSFKHSIEVRSLAESRLHPSVCMFIELTVCPSRIQGQCARSVQCSDRVYHRRC